MHNYFYVITEKVSIHTQVWFVFDDYVLTIYSAEKKLQLF